MSLIVAIILLIIAACIFISYERDRNKLIKRISELRETLEVIDDDH